MFRRVLPLRLTFTRISMFLRTIVLFAPGFLRYTSLYGLACVDRCTLLVYVMTSSSLRLLHTERFYVGAEKPLMTLSANPFRLTLMTSAHHTNLDSDVCIEVLITCV